MRPALTLLFIALIAAPIVYRKVEASKDSAGVSTDSKVALAQYGFHFQESAKAAGINFKYVPPVLDPKLNHIMPEVASMGAAISVVDFDKDGWPDFYVTNGGIGSKNALYRNMHDGTFKDVAAEVGLADVNQDGTGASTGAVWGDYDNDGYDDVFLYKWGRPELFHNDGGTHFTRVTDQVPLPKWANVNTAIWFDYDNDGKLDLFVGGYYAEDVNLWHLTTTKIMPESFEYANNGGRKYLFHNLGNGKFEEVSEKMGIVSRRWSLAAVAADTRGTGYPDLFIANDYGVSELFINEDGKHFREVGKESGIGYAPKSGMSASVGDVLNDGRLGFYVSNISEPGILIQGNNFWVPDTTKSDGVPKYQNMANSMGIALAGWSFGAQFGDFNNDGYQDIYVTNGNVSLDKEHNYWYDFTKIAGGNKAIINDAANWPPSTGRSLAGYQQKKIFMNDGSGQFKEVAQAVGVTDVFDGRSVALADFFNRGVLDAVVANENGPIMFYKNTATPANHWIAFDLQGQKSNESAIGAQVQVFWNGQQQIQEVSGGSGFCAENDRRLHFGLGKADAVDRVEIRWPSGKTQTITAPTLNQVHKIKEQS
ncbi:MAG TPA: CRTAC1 family protein [Bryobacteraceae bacterium]|nr:CRTAC1 family protein [Bryobacteraceae bacterium]